MGRLEDRCEALAKTIAAIRPIYAESGSDQQALLETMIGAAIWYLPKPPNAWTGRVSIGVLQAFHPDSKVDKPKISEEHVYPRKVAAKLLIEDEQLSPERMFDLFKEKYGRIHYITPGENKAVRPYQKSSEFVTPEEVYQKAKIELVLVEPDRWSLIKKRDRLTIDNFLQAQMIR